MNKKKDFIKLNGIFHGKIFCCRSGQSRIAGFTLVEMLVAITIFIIVITIIMGLLVSAVRTQRQNLAYQELLDQTSYVMEYMSRSIRMAMKDDIRIWGLEPKSCLVADKANYEFDDSDPLHPCLKFRNYHNQCQEFCLEDIGDGRRKLVEKIESGASVDLTSPGLNVFSFDVVDPTNSWQQPPANNNQPLVSIFLEIEGREDTRIRIQTSISQRNLDTFRP